MVQETEEVNAEHETGTAFLNLLPDTSQKYLGLYSDTRPQDSKTATLRNMLMVLRNYDALVSGDGACAGCGEKSILKAITSVTEAYMRPVFHAKADRFRTKADELDRIGVAKLKALFERKDRVYARMLPGYAKGSEVPGGIYFVVGPDKQLDAWDAYLKESSGARLHRLYGRDFWVE